MKKIIAIILVSAPFYSAYAQDSFQIINDTIRIIQLKDIQIAGFKKNAQQQLVSFFRNNHAATLEDIMGRLPELCLTRRGAYGMEPSIRYFNGGQVNVQLDGMNIHGACTDKMDPVTIYIEPVNLESLVVQTSNTGFMNGSSIGGTLNMKIAEPDFSTMNRITGSFSSGFQTASKSLYESTRLNYASGRLAIAASGTYRKNNDYRSGGGTIIPFSAYEKINYSLSVKFKQNRFNYFKVDLLADDGWNIGYSALPMDVGYAAARIGSVSFHHENSSKKIYKWTVKLYTNSVRHFMDDSNRPLVAIHMDMPGKSSTSGGYAEADMKLSGKHKLFVRADASSTYLKASMTMHQPGQPHMYMLTWPDNRRNQLGISASWTLQPVNSWLLQLMGRADIISSKLATEEAKDHVAVFDNNFRGRNDLLKNLSALISKKIGERFKISAGAGYTERMATASELFGFYLFNASDGYDYIGNPSLKPERCYQTDLSLTYTHKRNSIRLNGYYNRVMNFIAGIINPAYSTMTIGAKAVKTNVNLQHATVAGAEATGSFKPGGKWEVVTTFKYGIATDMNHNPLPSVSPFMNLNAVKFQQGPFSIQLETESAITQNRVSKQWGEDRTAGYLLLHTRFGYKTGIQRVITEIQAGVENIFDKKYHDHLDWGNISRPGRNIYILLKLDLK